MDQTPAIQPNIPDQNNSIQAPPNSQTTIPYSNRRILKQLIILLCVIIIILPITLEVYSLFKTRKNPSPSNEKKAQSIPNTKLSSLLPISQTTSMPTPIFIASMSGPLKRLNQDLQLISKPNFPITYYEAGTFNTGRYQGYKRIIATYEEYTEGGTTCGDSIFLTKDDISYLTSSDKFYAGEYNKSKVIQDASINFSGNNSVPATIRLDKNFSISLESYDSLSFKNKNTNPLDCTLNLLTNKNMVLLSSSKNYDIYFVNTLDNPIISDDSSVILVDKAGLPFQYNQSEEESHKYLAGTGEGRYSIATDNIFAYNDGGLRDSKFKNPDDFYKYGLGFSTDYPDYPKFMPDFSSLKLSDFIPVEDINGSIPIYILSGSAAAKIYQIRYKKIAGIAQTYAKATPTSENEIVFQTPTYTQYAQKHPFIFIKDYWGRFILFEETNYEAFHTPGPLTGG